MGLREQEDFGRWRKGIPVWGWGDHDQGHRGMGAEDVRTPKQPSPLGSLPRTAFIFKQCYWVLWTVPNFKCVRLRHTSTLSPRALPPSCLLRQPSLRYWAFWSMDSGSICPFLSGSLRGAQLLWGPPALQRVSGLCPFTAKQQPLCGHTAAHLPSDRCLSHL